jgi:hypothetical protein
VVENPVFDRLKEILEAIGDCLGAGRVLPALILIYTLMDSMSWLASDDLGAPVKKRFTRWVRDWVLKSNPLPCTPLELYAARCAVLHTLTSDSALTSSHKVRRIAYSFATETPSPLQEISDRVHPGEYIAIRVEDLYESLNAGIVAYLEDTMKHPAKKAAFEARGARHFSELSSGVLDNLLNELNRG